MPSPASLWIWSLGRCQDTAWWLKSETTHSELGLSFLPFNTCTSWVFMAGYSSTTNLCWIIGYSLLRQAGDIQNRRWSLVWTEDLVTWDVGRHSSCSVALLCKLLKMSQELKLDIRDSCLIDLKKGQRRESATSLATVRFSWWSQPWQAFIELVISI